jgi:hypothetical protein
MNLKDNVIRYFFGHPDAAVNLPASAAVPDMHEPRDGRIASPEGGWEPAGTTADGSLVIQSLVSGRYCVLTAQDFNERKLWLQLGPDHCERYTFTDPKTKKEKFDADALMREMVRSCQHMGLFDWSRVRGPGLYRDADELILNDGERVTTADGRRIVAAPDFSGPCYQTGSSPGFTVKTPCASDADLAQVLQAFGSFGFRTPGDLVAVLGWLVAVGYGSALDAQWMLLLTAEKGSGKTSLTELMRLLLGPQAYRRDGIPTAAQVLAALEERAMTVMVDEAESTADKRKVAELFEVLRSGTQSSGQKNHARVRGGRLHHYNAPAGALLAGINLPAMDPATASRSIKVTLDTLPQDAGYQALLDPARREETIELGARLRRLGVARWSVMRDTLRLARDVLTALGHDGRDASKWATVIAGYVTLTQDAPATAQRVEHLIGVLGVRQPEAVAIPRDGDACLSWMLGRKVAVLVSQGDERRKQHARIYDVIKEVVHGPQQERRHLIQQLELFGLRPLWSRGDGETESTWKLAVCSSHDNQGVRRLMQQSAWTQGGWKDAMVRLPGATSGVQRVAGRVERVVVLPMPAELLDTPAPDVYDLPSDKPGAKAVRGE